MFWNNGKQKREKNLKRLQIERLRKENKELYKKAILQYSIEK